MSVFIRRFVTAACLLAAGIALSPATALGSGDGIEYSLRLHGGASLLAAGDVNTGSSGWLSYQRSWINYWWGYTMTGLYHPMHGGFDVGADLIIHLSPRIGLGIGMSFLRSSRASTIVSMGLDARKFTVTPKLMAMPFRIGVHYALPLKGKLTLTANVGAAYYARTILHVRLRYESHDDLSDYWSESPFDAETWRLGNLGIQGGLGFERRLGRRLAFFTELQVRYARFNNFPKATHGRVDDRGQASVTSGKLYLDLYEAPEGNGTYFVVYEGTPPSYSEATEPKIDLSGVCLQAGVHIRL